MEASHRTLMKTESFNATIMQRSTIATKMIVYKCSTWIAKYTCSETWYWNKHRVSSVKIQKPSEEECKELVLQAHSNPDKFQRTGKEQFRLMTRDKYKCKYAKKNVQEFKHATVRAYEAVLKGSSRKLKLKLSNTPCYYHHMSCRLEDQSLLIWNRSSHIFTKWKVIGDYLVHHMGKYYSIPELLSGGSAQFMSQDHNRVQLSNGILIVRNTSHHSKEDTNFMKNASLFFKEYGIDKHQAMAGAHLLKVFSQIFPDGITFRVITFENMHRKAGCPQYSGMANGKFSRHRRILIQRQERTCDDTGR